MEQLALLLLTEATLLLVRFLPPVAVTPGHMTRLHPPSQILEEMEEVAEVVGGIPTKPLITMEEVTAKTAHPVQQAPIMRKVAMARVLPRENLESQTVSCMLVVVAVEHISIRKHRYTLQVEQVVAEMVLGTVLVMERGTQVRVLPTQAVAVVVVPTVV